MLINGGLRAIVFVLRFRFVRLLPVIAAPAGFPVFLRRRDRTNRIGGADILYSRNEICHRTFLAHHLPTVARKRNIA